MGQIVSAANRTFHPEHFVCEFCSQPFPNGKFVVAPDDKLYCQEDYFELFAKRCHACDDIIKGNCVNAKGTYFHPQHFVCVNCGTTLVNNKFKLHKKTKDSYCVSCMDKVLKSQVAEEHMCSRCKRPIIGEYILLNGQYLHPEHYRCFECGCDLSGGNCFEFEGDLYCKEHYELCLRKNCAKCDKPIMGRSITALGNIWHTECFTCSICNVGFGEGEYFEKEGKAYCQEHYIALFGKLCANCNKPIIENGAKFLDKMYHVGCFSCSKCEKALRDGKFTDWDSQPMCLDCYGALPKKIRKRDQKRKKMEKLAEKRREKEKAKAQKAGN